jgi:hypothetical protein
MQKIIHRALKAEIQRLQTPAKGKIAENAVNRLTAVADYFPDFLALLAEPWLTEPVADEILVTLADCARVHLYARILDDALDENLPIHRLHLLRAQSLLWRACSALAARYPSFQSECSALIDETVDAVQGDDVALNPVRWGPKNHHLLLAPLLLSGNSAAYQACRPGLSALITLVQAGDEWRQGSLDTGPVRTDLLNAFPVLLNTQGLAELKTHGWHGAADRIVWESRQLIGALQRDTTRLHRC